MLDEPYRAVLLISFREPGSPGALFELFCGPQKDEVVLFEAPNSPIELQKVLKATAQGAPRSPNKPSVG